VTGAGRGIGFAIANRLAEEGATVVVNDLDEERAESAASDLRAAGHEAMAVPADVTDPAACESMVASVVDEYGQLDVLVNNAGFSRMVLFTDTDPDLRDQLVEINYKGQLNCASAVVDHMMERESGTIIGIASDAGRVGSTGEAVYAGAKAGVIGFTKSLARELARFDVTCNAVSPGLTDTPLLDDMQAESELAEKVHEGVERAIPLGRPAEPEDVAGAVAFLASEDADFITGQVLSVNGGLAMC
jgi:2-hydroxycyclohexanecarboxyl-CoA dehydrogenase